MSNGNPAKERVDALLKRAKAASATDAKAATKPRKISSPPATASQQSGAAAPAAPGGGAPPPPSPPPPLGSCTISIPGLGPISCIDGVTSARCQGVAEASGGTASWVQGGKCPD